MTKMINKARKYINDKAREWGNKLVNTRYGGLGDLLTVEVDKPVKCAAPLALAAAVGCSTTPTTANESLYEPIDIRKEAKEEIKRNNQSFDNWEDRYDARNEFYKRKVKLEVKRKNTNLALDAEKAWLEDQILETHDKGYDVDGSDGDDSGNGDDGDGDNNQGLYNPMFLHLSPYIENRNPISAEGIDVDNLGKINLNGIQLGLGTEDIFGYINIGSNLTNTIENAHSGLSYSNIESDLTSYALGGQWNFINTENFDMGLYGHLMFNQENIDGYSIDTHGNRTEISKDDTISGYGAGLKLGFKPCKWFELSYGVGKNWYGQSDAIKEEWADQVMASFKIPF